MITLTTYAANPPVVAWYTRHEYRTVHLEEKAGATIVHMCKHLVFSDTDLSRKAGRET